jgi:hypothetical protein
MRARAALAVALAVPALAACGGGDSASSGGRLTLEEYVAAADAICAEADAEIEALEDPASAQDAADYLPRAKEIAERQLERLRELVPPEEIEARIDEALDLLQQQIDLADELLDAIESEDLDRFQELVDEGEAKNERADEIAREIGLEECGSDE